MHATKVTTKTSITRNAELDRNGSAGNVGGWTSERASARENSPPHTDDLRFVSPQKYFHNFKRNENPLFHTERFEVWCVQTAAIYIYIFVCVSSLPPFHTFNLHSFRTFQFAHRTPFGSIQFGSVRIFLSSVCYVRLCRCFHTSLYHFCRIHFSNYLFVIQETR